MKPKSRSYSGRKEIEIKNYALKKKVVNQLDPNPNTESLPLLSNRSRGNNNNPEE
jgi:hypothetical protein